MPSENFGEHTAKSTYSTRCTKFSELSKYNLILEVGCGTGYCFSGYNTFENEPSVVGIDISLESLRKCHNNFRNFSFILCDGNYLPFKAETFDGIIMINLLHHVPNYNEILEGSAKVIKTGGNELIVDLTSANLLINFAREIWFLLPLNFKDKSEICN